MTSRINQVLVLLFIAIRALNLQAGTHNSVLGYSGVIITPTANIMQDGELTAHIARLPKLYAKNYFEPDYERTALVAVLGFMPFLEASFGFVRPDNFTGGVGDRTVSLRFKMLDESTYCPALSVGLHDFFAVEGLGLEPAEAQHFAALYVVGTKEFQLGAPESFLFLTLGYGPDWLPAGDKNLQGLFGSVLYSPVKPVALMLEHDSAHVNAGIRFDFFSHVNYTMSFWQLKYVMHHLSFSINLK